ncbi:MAG: FAD-dependent oxidoreductase, partial [Blastococcus sp.]|nr:FAD-dependent oxidoreductase [Blastococcus sp.]
VARDLRRRYGEDYRVLRASSAAEGLEALRELKLRGDPVAVLLADYRMPEMNGIDFLEMAMDLFPRARRALLTAYADTDAAISAINVVDVDAYLLKPWDPPEEKLYPTVDAMLKSWRETPDPEVEGVKIVGHRWSAPSFRARDLLARNAVPYTWFSVDEPEGQRILAAAGAGREDIPVVVTPDAQVLLHPSESELAAVAGLAVDPREMFYDLIVVGGGPAGLGAAVYGASEGLRTVLVEREATGGQAGQSSRIENYLGFPDGVSGGQLAERARRQAVRFGAELLLTRDVVALETHGPKRVVRLDDGRVLAAHAVVLATGISYRSLGVDGVDDLTGRGVYYGSAMTEAVECTDRDIYVVGGANSAGQAAVYLSRFAKSVSLLVRGESLEASMSAYLIEQIAGIENISVRTCCTVAGAQGDGHLEAVTLQDANTGERETL